VSVLHTVSCHAAVASTAAGRCAFGCDCAAREDWVVGGEDGGEEGEHAGNGEEGIRKMHDDVLVDGLLDVL